VSDQGSDCWIALIIRSVTTLSVLLRLEASVTSMSLGHPIPPQTHTTTKPLYAPASPTVRPDLLMLPHQRNSITKVQDRPTTLPLRKLGIRQRKVVRYMRRPGDSLDPSQYTADEVVSETYETSWTVPGYVFHWSNQRYPFGSILPSLRVSPVVRNIYVYEDLIYKGTVQEIQKAFTSGVLHPFSTDEWGHNLLHVSYEVFLNVLGEADRVQIAAACRRPDIYLLLSEYGLKPEMNAYGTSPLFRCLNWVTRGDSQRTIDTFRSILLHPDQTDDLDWRFKSIAKFQSRSFVVETHLDIVEWLWTHAALLYYGADLVCLRAVLAQILLEKYPPWHDFLNDDINRLLAKLMDDEMKNEYLRGTYSLLAGVNSGYSSIDSASDGVHFLNLLSELGLDAEQCIANGMESAWGQDRFTPDRPTRKIIFERSEARIWGLRWEWDYDPQEPGYDVVSEFNALAAESWVSEDYSWWPFDEFRRNDWPGHRDYRCPDCLGKREVRFDRHRRVKACKERARTGQKQPRSRMPGTWNW
jgi:hypothetical protein